MSSQTVSVCGLSLLQSPFLPRSPGTWRTIMHTPFPTYRQFVIFGRMCTAHGLTEVWQNRCSFTYECTEICGFRLEAWTTELISQVKQLNFSVCFLNNQSFWMFDHIFICFSRLWPHISDQLNVTNWTTNKLWWFYVLWRIQTFTVYCLSAGCVFVVGGLSSPLIGFPASPLWQML